MKNDPVLLVAVLVEWSSSPSPGRRACQFIVNLVWTVSGASQLSKSNALGSFRDIGSIACNLATLAMWHCARTTSC
eukprot:6473094-Amphidinium_carterae.1